MIDWSGGSCVGRNEQGDTSGLPRLALNEPALVERDDHAMDGRRRDAEEVLKVTLGRRAAVQHRVGVDEGQVLTLRRGEWDRHAGSSVIRYVAGGPAMHLRYRVDLEESERQQLEGIVASGTGRSGA